tara:strand:+ start:36 stop:1253 length:1218 start_codon:yes stop_codon:yes gene_type:complete
MKKIILLVISFVTVSCGGGGGGGSTPTPTDPGGGTVGPSYTKITDPVTDYTWDFNAMTRLHDFIDPYMISLFVDNEWGVIGYNCGVCDYAGMPAFSGSTEFYSEFIENSNTSFSYSYSGQRQSAIIGDPSFNYSFSVNQGNVSTYSLGDRYIMSQGMIDGKFIRFFSPLKDYLGSIGVEYAHPVWMEIRDPSYEAFQQWIENGISEGALWRMPGAYGSFTEVSDMPSSNSTRNFITLAHYSENDALSYEDNDYVFEGNGTLNINFDTNTLDGQIILTTPIDYSKFVGDDAGAFLCSTPEYIPPEDWDSEDCHVRYPEYIFNIRNGQIVGNEFTADLEWDDVGRMEFYQGTTLQENSYGGSIKGNFFGPKADEFSATYFIEWYDTPRYDSGSLASQQYVLGQIIGD